MERKNATVGLPDFGPCPWAQSDAPVPLAHVLGPKAGRMRSQLRQLCPKKPGVYGMVDENGELIYLGKAKNLRVRLLSYFRSRSRPAKAGRILRHTCTIIWEIQASEFAALHRELELIRRWRPRFNVQGQPLRRRLGFLCLGRRPAPYAFLTSKSPARVLASFGPISAGPRAEEAVRRLNDFFCLRDCPQAQEMIFPDQGSLFPMVQPPGCLRFEIGTCLGPCTGTCARSVYSRQVQAALEFLHGKDDAPLYLLEREMAEASAALQFERAASLRDRLQSLRWLVRQLQGLRKAREQASFIYPVRGWNREILWYYICAGRTVAVSLPPRDSKSAQEAARIISTIFSKKSFLNLEPFEHVDGRLLVSQWFQKHPRELARILTPEQALAKCSQVV